MLGYDGSYAGAVAVGANVYFAPSNERDVGMFNTTSQVFSYVAEVPGERSSEGLTYTEKYNGAAAVGALVVFAPHHQDNVGVLDTITNVFTTVATTGDAASGNYKYRGAVAVGNIVYFAPSSQNNVGIFNTTSNTFSTVATTGVAASSGQSKYDGAVAVVGRCMLTPC